MRFAPIYLLLSCIYFLPLTASAADIEAGKARASTCFSCHGVDGISLNPKYPSLAGQSTEYLIKQLNAFRSGSRNDAIMTPMASSMSDVDVENVSAFFASRGAGSQAPLPTGSDVSAVLSGTK